MGLDHTWNNSLHRMNCRQFITSVTRPTHCLCGFTYPAIKGSKSIHIEVSTDLGWNNTDHIDP